MYMIMLSCFIMIIVYFVFISFFFKNEMEKEMISSYECGFDPYSLTRMTFSYRFYLISILFIIFDVEISLMLPVPFMISMDMGLFFFLFFMLILILGLLYEYYCGSLNWLGSFD